jgi:hypothetical protein
MTDDVKGGKVFGCHVDLADDEEPDGCVIEYGGHDDCIYAKFPSGRLRTSKWDCPHWKPFKSDAASVTAPTASDQPKTSGGN